MISHTERHNARRRARHKAARGDVSAEIELLYKPLDQWDDEEIARGRPRGPDGTFRGARPAWLTPTLQVERQRRLRQLMMDEVGTLAGDALRILGSLLDDARTDDAGKPVVSAAVKVDISKYLLDQFIGKPRTPLDVNDGDKVFELMSAILVNPDGEPAHQIIDGEVVADDPTLLRELD